MPFNTKIGGHASSVFSTNKTGANVDVSMGDVDNHEVEEEEAKNATAIENS